MVESEIQGWFAPASRAVTTNNNNIDKSVCIPRVQAIGIGYNNVLFEYGFYYGKGEESEAEVERKGIMIGR